MTDSPNNKRPLRVLVRPCYAFFLGNALFQPKHNQATHWQTPFVELRSRAAAVGIEIDTWDMHPLESADIVVFQDLPRQKSEILEARARAPKAKFVLKLIESSLSRPHFFVRANHELFDAVLTYNPHLCDERRTFHYYLPLGAPQAVPDLPFADRRTMVLLNSNRCIGLWARRQPGLSGLPFFGPAFGGYKVGLWNLLRQNAGELYSRRRRLARLAEHMNRDILDVYGAGWSGEPMGWIHKLLPNRKFALSRGELKAEKMPLLAKYRFVLAFENMRGDVGYISEKIFDAFYAGAVPIYLGDEHITDFVPAEAFVDARLFRHDRDLLAFARDCDEPTWRRMRDAGHAFIHGPGMYKFGPDGFAERIIKVLQIVAGRSAAQPQPT